MNREETPVDISEKIQNIDTVYKANKNFINIAGGAVILLIIGYFGYQNFYLKPMQENSQKEIYMVQRFFEMDSLDLVLNGDGQFRGAVDIAEDFGPTPAGKLANYYAGMAYLRKGEFQNAIDHLKNFDADDKIVTPLAKGAIGDAYVELNELEKGAEHYLKAAKMDANQFTAPYFYRKAGIVFENLGKNEEALKAYKKIENDFKESNEASEIAKYIARVEAKLGK